MGKGDWLAVIGVTLALITGGFAAWVQNESRISGVENAVEDLDRATDILVNEILELTKEVAKLKGLHETHKATEHHAKH